MRLMLHKVTALLFSATLATHALAVEPKDLEIRLIELSDDYQSMSSLKLDWRMCGTFFAFADSPSGKVIYFSYDRYFGEGVRTAYRTASFAPLRLWADMDLLSPSVILDSKNNVTGFVTNIVDHLTIRSCSSAKVAG
ncbi:MAG: hypothetical protein JWN18_93 [Parcubacteria group bacterium]|nr:hypothetical protein [Parcubacteria group bacterium]